jgi:hypothetical protein
MDGKDYSEIDKQKEYKKMLLVISRSLDEKAFKEVKHMSGVKKARAERMEHPIDVFEYLEEVGELNVNDVSNLIKLLEDLSRIADAKLVKDYQNKFPYYYNGSSKGTGDVTEKTVTQAGMFFFVNTSLFLIHPANTNF